MEVKLNFKEKEFRDLYENSYVFLKDELKNKIHERNKTRNVLLVITALIFLLTFVHWDWVYYGLIFFLFTILFIGWSEIIKLKTKRFIQRSRKEVDDFVYKAKPKKDIKYWYDDHNIRYCESGEVVDTYLWKDLKKFEDGTEYFILHFYNNKPTIMIPRTMVENKEELIEFEGKISDVMKNAR